MACVRFHRPLSFEGLDHVIITEATQDTYRLTRFSAIYCSFNLRYANKDSFGTTS